ncbi:MAG: 50S ribosomal protein L17 [Firmicutes bacterium]|nr:50S ribosomal protein L17 [Bacillota bacterium]
MEQRKLGLNTTQRMALLKNQVTELLWYGKLDTTWARAKEVQRIAEKILTTAFRAWDDTVKKVEERKNAKGQTIKVEVVNDGPKRLAARRSIMSKLNDIQEKRAVDEPYDAFLARTEAIKHPLIEKIFNEYAPRIQKRESNKGAKGGYTRVLKTGFRRGDAAETAMIEVIL